MGSTSFKDYRVQVKAEINAKSIAFLYEVGELLKGAAADNSPVATGQLRGSWDYKVDDSKGEVTIGSPLENAIWTEFGTGEYAFYGNGRKGGWHYQDEDGNWHHTKGKKPKRGFFKAFSANKTSIVKRAEQLFGSIE